MTRRYITPAPFDELTRVVRAAGFVEHPDDGPLP